VGEGFHGKADLANTRNASSSLEAENVADLTLAWSRPLRGEVQGTVFTGSPVVTGNVAYLQGPSSDVQAIDLRSGRTLWEKRYGIPAGAPSGVTVAEELVFGATPTNAFALEARTGKEIWSVKLAHSSERIEMAPGYHDGRVYFSTRPYREKGGEVGVLWALDAKTGKRIWHFDTVPRGLWGHPDVNFGGGLSRPPAFDGEGSIYVGTGNAGPIPGTQEFPWGSSRPGPNLYTDSVVKLDEKTGRVDWHYQVTPHGICNWDMGGPLLAESDGRRIVIAAGLSGIVVALDRESGKLLWKQPVGVHNGHDDDGLVAMRGEFEDLDLPMTVSPGVFGGVGGFPALAGSTLFVPVVNSPTRLVTQESAGLTGSESGELVALDVGTGAVKWTQRFSTPLYGSVLASNDLVFASSFDGKAYAFDGESGKRLWSEQLPSYGAGGLTAVGDLLLIRSSYSAEGAPQELLAYRIS